MITWKKGYYGWWNAYDETGKKLVVPSVTKVVDSKDDPELDTFREEVGEEQFQKIMKLAADRGTAFHKFMENYYLAFAAKGDLEKALLYTQTKSIQQLKEEKIAEKQIETGRGMFYQMLESFAPNSDSPEVHEVLGLEHKVVNFKIPYRGAYDINYLWPSMNKLNNVITDYKSASSYVEKGSVKERKYKLQLSGYWSAYEQMTGNSLDVAKIWVSVKNSGTQEIMIGRSEYNDLWEEFVDLCTHFHNQHGQTIEMFKDYKIAD
jgi:hypothetical protein